MCTLRYKCASQTKCPLLWNHCIWNDKHANQRITGFENQKSFKRLCKLSILAGTVVGRGVGGCAWSSSLFINPCGCWLPMHDFNYHLWGWTDASCSPYSNKNRTPPICTCPTCPRAMMRRYTNYLYLMGSQLSGAQLKGGCGNGVKCARSDVACLHSVRQTVISIK